MSYVIMTDTSANLPTSLLKEHNIAAVPFSYNIGGKEYMCTDTDSFDGAEYYGQIEKGELATTSQIPPQRFIEYMTPLLEKGNDILYIGMSSGISGAFNSAMIAAEELVKKFPSRIIELFDTKAASLGEGNIVMLASKAKESGEKLQDLLEKLKEWRDRTYQVFTVDSLIHLHRSGRISNAAAIIGTVLQIKPLLKGNEDGKIVLFRKERGRNAAIKALAEKYNQLVENAENQIIGIAHANAPDDAKHLADLIREKHHPKDILNVVYEPVTGSHVGPGAVALFFMGALDVRSK